MPIIRFGQFRPDQPNLDDQGQGYTTHVKNVWPDGGLYRPFLDLAVYSTNALNARCQGCVSFTDDTGEVHIYAGDQHNLYKLTSASTDWTTCTASSSLATPTDEVWNFTMYNKTVLATNWGATVQYGSLTVTTSFNPITVEDASGTNVNMRARYLATAQNFVLVGNTYDDVDGNRPQRVRWSAYADPQDWKPSKTTQAGFQDLEENLGWVQGIVTGIPGNDAMIFLDRGIVQMNYTGDELIWRFTPLVAGVGTPAPNSLVKVGNIIYFLGTDGFYAFDGVNLRPIGNQAVDRYVLDDIDEEWWSRVSGVQDPTYPVVYWGYQSASGGGSTPDKVAIYNWQTGEWGFAEVDHELLCMALTTGTTLDDLGTLYGSLGAVPASLDSRIWVGADVEMGGFNTDHKFGYFTGSALAAEIDTPEIAIADGGRAKVTEVWPIVDGGPVSMTIGGRNRQMDSLSFTTTATQNSVGFIPCRHDARYHRVRIHIPAGTTWDKASGVQLTVARTGRR